MLRLLEDEDHWPHLDTRDYNDWLTKEMEKTDDGSRPGMSIKGFMQISSRSRGKKDKGRGPTLNKDQNAYDSTMTLIMSNDLTRAKLGRVIAGEMGGSYCAQKQAQGVRTNINDMDSKQ